MTFPVYRIDGWQSYAEEQMGSKRKIWFRSSGTPECPDGEEYLFKYPREGFGEDWAEKAAAEVAETMQIPHAEVELATFMGQKGTISKSFMSSDQENLYHGNQLLELFLPEYDTQKNFGQSDHTYQRIVNIIGSLGASAASPMLSVLDDDSGIACLAGYLTLDALIGNSDRHHENWALIVTFSREEDLPAVSRVKLAPTFDHASSLGRELSDERRLMLLNDVEKARSYYEHCPSRIYWNETDARPLHPAELVRRAAEQSPAAFAPWLDRAAKIDDRMIDEMFSSFPPGWISSPALAFAKAFIGMARGELAEIHRSIVQ